MSASLKICKFITTQNYQNNPIKEWKEHKCYGINLRSKFYSTKYKYFGCCELSDGQLNKILLLVFVQPICVEVTLQILKITYQTIYFWKAQKISNVIEAQPTLVPFKKSQV